MEPIRSSDEGNSGYVRALVAALAGEMQRAGDWCPHVGDLMRQCDWLQKMTQEWRLDSCHDDWRRALDRYRKLGFAVAGRLNESAHISRSYGSMDEFWADANAQATGSSPYTFWDTYEHGRRRQIERIVADVYGAEDALLLNAGMSAVTAAIEAADLRPGDRIVTGRRNYFESSEFLDTYLAKRGIRIVRAAIDDGAAMAAAITRWQPKLVLFETATNSPDVEVPHDLGVWLGNAPETLFVCDNTVQGTLTKWFAAQDLADILPDRFLVVESATKYLSQSVMAGIVYGRRALVDRVRAIARVTGRHLQEKAFNYLREGDLLHVGKRLKLHSRNAVLMAEQLSGCRKAGFAVRLPSGDSHMHAACRPLFAEGVGGILFLVPVAGELRKCSAQALCRQVLASWQDRLGLAGYLLPIRAGFGWSETSARLYETGALNQPDAPAYMRISVGIEPGDVALRFGETLREALEAHS